MSSRTATAARSASSEVANVYDGVENPRNGELVQRHADRSISRFSASPARTRSRSSTPSRRCCRSSSRSCPPPLTLAIRSDRSVSIRESVDDVKFTLLLTVFLVVLVIFLFLRNLSATIIPSLALPFSIVGTFAVMWALGYSLDNLSLMALTLSVGFVVDDAIVMLENIVRHMEMGKTRMQAALDGSKEIAFTIVSMTLSLAAVFIPVLFMGGIVGRLMHEFAVTIAAAILVSGLVSLTLTPMLCSRFLKPPHEQRHGRLLQRDRAHASTPRCARYGWTLTQTIRFKGTTMIVSALLLVGTIYLFSACRRASSRASTPASSSGQIEAHSGHRLRGDGRRT